MGRKAKCKYCNKEINTDDSFSPTGKSPWYCNEEEFHICEKAKNDKQEFTDEILSLAIYEWGLEGESVFIIKKALLTHYNKYGKEIMVAYLEIKMEEIERSIKNKNFATLVKKAHYIMAIINNSLPDFAKGYTPVKEREEIHEVEFYMPSQIKYAPIKQRRAMTALEEDGD